MSETIKKYIGEFESGSDVRPDDAEGLLDEMIAEKDEDRLTELFVRWNAKGVTEDEIFQFASILRRRSLPVRSSHDIFVDIVGTGGTGVKTFNVSTAAAFVVSGAGVPVAKHGNKAATSKSGSSDVLPFLGIPFDAAPHVAETSLNELGICFMYAPNFHRLSATLGSVRRALGFPTVFNCVGPLCNPANAPVQLIGVWNADVLRHVAGALAKLGTRRSWVVSGHGNIDEISLSGTTVVAEVENGNVRNFEISPANFGLDSCTADGLNGLSPQESADLIRSVLSNRLRGSSAEKLILLNAAASLLLADRVENLREGTDLAVNTIRNGNALAKLNRLAEAEAV